jgi:hypothetical protein
LREVANYLDKRVLRAGASRVGPASPGQTRSSGLARPDLAPADIEAAGRCLSPEVCPEGLELLSLLRTYADPRGRVPHAVDLSSRVLEDLCGQRRVRDGDGRKRRAYVVALEELSLHLSRRISLVFSMDSRSVAIAPPGRRAACSGPSSVASLRADPSGFEVHAPV